MNKNGVNKVLLIVGAVLLGILLAPRIFNLGGTDKNFKVPFEDIDTSALVTLEVFPPLKDAKKPTHLTKKESNWYVLRSGKSIKASLAAVNEVLAALSDIRPGQLVSRSKAKWSEYQLDDSSAIRVLVYNSKKTPKEMYIGKVNFIPVRGFGGQNSVDGETYIRFPNSEDVYVTKGFLSFTFNREMSSFFDGTVCNCTKDLVSDLSFNYSGDSSFTLSKIDNKFSIQGQAVDSIRVNEFLRQLCTYTTQQFAEDSEKKKARIGELVINQLNQNPVTLQLWDTDSTEYFLMTSSINTDHVFKVMRNADWELKFKSSSFFTSNP